MRAVTIQFVERGLERPLCYGFDGMRTLTICLMLVLAAGCNKRTPSTTPAGTAPYAVSDPVATPALTTDVTGPASPPRASTSSTTRAVLRPYERLRASLASDDLSTVRQAARELEAAARKGSSTGAKSYFDGIATAASKLVGASDLDAARLAFGEVSKHLITLLASDTRLSGGLHVFKCPMAAGYKKWVQPTKDLENPYMGTRMLTCGSETSWD